MVIGARPIRRLLPMILAFLVVLVPPFGALSQAASADCADAFGPDLADFRMAVGDAMGQPIDCETPIDLSGDTIQHTSTGTEWLAPTGLISAS